jgi:diketogulonate reductase-like aldo/keto reductase
VQEDLDVTIEDTWRAMEELVKQGYTKSIGISNFNSEQIKRVLKIATIKPVVNQVSRLYYSSRLHVIRVREIRASDSALESAEGNVCQ